MGPNEFREQLRKAYRRLLHPLVRILIRNGFTAPETEELIRQVFIDAATSDEFEVSGRELSDTRVAILTGLSRKEVHRLRYEPNRKMSSTNLTRVGRVIAGWNQDPDFTGPYGLPLALPFEDDAAIDAPSFTELVRRHSGDMAPRVMLDELMRTGLAILEEGGLIRNTGRTYIPNQTDPAAIERLGKVVARLADTLDFNNRSTVSADKRFERDVITDIGLSAEQYDEFREYLAMKCQQLLETIDNWLATQEGRVEEYKRRERIPKDKLFTGVGVYHFLDEKLLFEEED
jgi:hypothetical protein